VMRVGGGPAQTVRRSVSRRGEMVVLKSWD